MKKINLDIGCQDFSDIISAKNNPILLDPTCKVRKCVINKKYLHCGYCDQYPCDIFPSEPTQEELVQKIDVEKRWTWEDEKLMEAYSCKKIWMSLKKVEIWRNDIIIRIAYGGLL